MVIIFSGSIGRCGVGGLAWMNMQYLAGLRSLGHEVYYLEECGQESWVYDWEAEQLTTELDYPAAYVRDCLEPIGLSGKWIYRAGSHARGMETDEFREICSRADLFIVHAVPMALWRDEYDAPQRRVFIDVDPGFIQMDLANGHPELENTIRRCERLFTIAQRIGAEDCPIPTNGLEWLKTLPPVSLSEWSIAKGSDGTHFTSIMQWKGFREVEYDGVVYGQKDREFPKFIDLPRHTLQPLQIAIMGTPPDDLLQHGWEVVPGWIPSRTPWSYREFIQKSRAEFGVAKHGYVLMRGGWFSDRSVCYLASGRPVLVEDTGLSDWLPTGEGVVTFSNLTEAISGIEKINADYEQNCLAARRLAEEYFAAEKVLAPLLETAMD
ncbi:MAG TPA: hypothetical protein VF599_24270 [Pyrinomonadaceae bacterium]|jgi:hypothetical protein